ncbi:MAG: N-acetylmannosamine-6-phosphate 2-epimerase [Meiothermus sp.]|uniref:N-acetylmannosamine-6-phosphate 2-epimerase n=1 Tax=Meiothermus sp. TaxID=1955249 RepID=UPI0025F4ED50|nr:N-acetylmannosamine-6-phosphate 2-epimerase [Meiothermus sp.]MCS7068378.1 N-acetylmannosamine-6-phosphate 2-epimerase [Meiothermus sp.]MDW8424829.1 N-acetylmannosamine-6-phosphate 2-epimerase [Meiothermus sp.]
MLRRAQILEQLRHGLIASCQPVRGGPLDAPAMVAALAQATIAGGAVGLRIEGLADLAATRPAVSVPIVGLVKREVAGSPVYITPALSDVRALAEQGADIIAVDATLRPRPVEVGALIEAIHAQGCLAMADVSTLEEGLMAHALGADLVGTTLSGYTDYSSKQQGPDLELVRALAGQGVRVVAEGRIATPLQARQALDAGAFAVTVGTALTRVEWVTRGFVEALREVTR